MFSSKNINHYLFAAGVIFITSLFASRMKQSFYADPNDEYELIRKYLLNDSPMYGHNRPKLWIHSKYEVNARKWKDFYSRNTTDLNQTYIGLTIKTIVNHCGDDFNVCLIDDETFSKLLPSWDIDLTDVAEPMRSHFRELGLMQLLYFYGGMVVPNSLVCLKNLKSFYEEGIAGNRPFVCEGINRTVNIRKQKQKLLFIPELTVVGAAKNDPTILELVEFLKKSNKNPHFQCETDFLGETSQWCLDAINRQKMTLVGGERIGIKTRDRKTILLEDLMEEDYLDLNSNAVGVYIPREEVLNRTKFQWFAVLPAEDILKSNMIISKYLTASIVDSTDEYHKEKEMRSIVSI